MGTIRFELRKEKKDKDGLSPIRIIYQIKGARKYYSTGQKTFEENWDETEQQCIYVKKGKLLDLDVKKINSKLQDLKRDIEKIEHRFEANGIVYSPEMVIEEMQAKDAPKVKKDSSS